VSLISKIIISFKLFKLSQLSGDGKYGRSVEEKLRAVYKASGVLLVNSCSSALDICSKMIKDDQRNEVIVPAFTFVTSVSQFAEKGLKIIFCDIEKDTFCLDPEKVKKLITPQTIGIVVTNYAGSNPYIGEISKIAKANGLVLIEDNAHGIFASNQNKLLGTYGDLSVLSFHETKNLSSGEGGALIINNRDYLDRAIKIRDKGTNRREFVESKVNKYEWVENGSNYYMSEICALVLDTELECFEGKQAKRKKIWMTYYTKLLAVEKYGLFTIPKIENYSESNFHIFYLIFINEKIRTSFIRFMNDRNISTPFHYLNLSKSPRGKGHLSQEWELSTTESISKQLVRLPLYSSMGYLKQRKVINAIKLFLALNKV
jgi:dTDP-4-amino-4,6-dideoxygalactose transaminase